jgi:hypothetical protein
VSACLTCKALLGFHLQHHKKKKKSYKNIAKLPFKVHSHQKRQANLFPHSFASATCYQIVFFANLSSEILHL